MRDTPLKAPTEKQLRARAYAKRRWEIYRLLNGVKNCIRANSDVLGDGTAVGTNVYSLLVGAKEHVERVLEELNARQRAEKSHD